MQLTNLANLPRKTIAIAIIIAVLALGNIFFGVQYFLQTGQIYAAQKQAIAQQTNKKVVAFLNLFIQKVLKSDKEISFEDRLQLENAIRDINDPELLAKWDQFTGGTSEAQIQEGVKALLEALGKKIYY